MQKRYFAFFCIIFLCCRGKATEMEAKEVAKGKSLTLKDRKILARRWERGDKAAQIAADMGVSNATIYAELRRGFDGTLDQNSRRRYDAERGQAAFQEALRNRGRRAAVTAESGGTT